MGKLDEIKNDIIKITDLGKKIFKKENIEIIGEVIKDVKKYEQDPARIETINYIWNGVKKLMGDYGLNK